MSCFTEVGLYSKKQYIFNDADVKHLTIPLGILNIISLTDMYNRARKLNLIENAICLSLSAYTADLITALIHVFYLDRQLFTYKKGYIDKSTKKIILNTAFGYTSCHHIFPSNHRDVEDSIIIRDNSILAAPLLTLNYFNPNDGNAYFNYAVIYQLIMSSVIHKYTHEGNHNRFVREPFKLLQDLSFTISADNHKKHHELINCNYSGLYGVSDKLMNQLMNKIDGLLNIQPYVVDIELCKKYVKKYGDDITIQFVGDIEGEIVVNLVGNIIKVKRSASH